MPGMALVAATRNGRLVRVLSALNLHRLKQGMRVAGG